jgi:hypothetical protein
MTPNRAREIISDDREREAQRRGIKRLAILSQDYPRINNHVRALKTEAGRVGLQVVDEQRLEESVVDFEVQITQAEAASPDVLYVEAFNPALDRLGRQLAYADVRHITSRPSWRPPSASGRSSLKARSGLANGRFVAIPEVGALHHRYERHAA